MKKYKFREDTLGYNAELLFNSALALFKNFPTEEWWALETEDLLSGWDLSLFCEYMYNSILDYLKHILLARGVPWEAIEISSDNIFVLKNRVGYRHGHKSYEIFKILRDYLYKQGPGLHDLYIGEIIELVEAVKNLRALAISETKRIEDKEIFGVTI